MRLSNKIVLASTNEDKLREFKALFRDYPEIEIVSPKGLIRNASKLALVEKYDTYIENAAAKARVAHLGTHYPTLADDSGIEVDALGGKPGVFSARYAQTPKGAGSLSTIEQSRANVELLLSEVKKAGGSRQARFVCTLVLVIEGILVRANGTLEGEIADAPRGENGFGYDPIFIPKGSTRTLAEMREEEKNTISHRAKAVQDLMVQIKAHGIVFAKP